MRIKDIPYIFNPVYMGSNIYIRKKILSKGYDILEGITNYGSKLSYDSKYPEYKIRYTLIRTIDTLEKVEKYLRKRYNIVIKL